MSVEINYLRPVMNGGTRVFMAVSVCARTPLSRRHQTDIREQLQRMCPLLDWRNEYFTMNEVSVKQ